MIISFPGAETSGEPARTPFQAAFDEAACARLAAPGADLRGRTMAADGLVGGLRIRPHGATGTVTPPTGVGKPFEVRLSVGDDGPSYGCTCDDGSAGAFCGHAVAVALVATGTIDPGEEGEDADDELDDGDDRKEYDEDEGYDEDDPYGLRPLLSGLTRDELVDLILDLADADDALADDLLITLTSR